MNGVGGAGFLAVAAENTTGKVDAKELRVTPPVLILRRLEGDAANRARDGAKVTANAALATIRITGQDDSATVPGKQIRLLPQVPHGCPWLEGVQEDVPNGSE